MAFVRAGETDAFGELVELHKGRVMSLCVALMRDAHAAEELAQDVFVRAYRYLDTFDDRRPFYPWLAKIAYRLAQARWRRQRREVPLPEDAHDRIASDAPDADPLQGLVADERARRLWRAVQALPDGQRAAAVLYYCQGMDTRTVARVLGVSTGAVKTFLFRARKRLHTTLAANDGEADRSRT